MRPHARLLTCTILLATYFANLTHRSLNLKDQSRTCHLDCPGILFYRGLSTKRTQDTHTKDTLRTEAAQVPVAMFWAKLREWLACMLCTEMGQYLPFVAHKENSNLA